MLWVYIMCCDNESCGSVTHYLNNETILDK